MSDTVGRIEQLTEEVRRDLENQRGYFATLSPEFEQRVAAEVERRMATATPYPQFIAESDQHPPGVDHRELLRKYIAHVHYHESIDYLDRLEEGDDSPRFTAEEKAELVRLASEEDLPHCSCGHPRSDHWSSGDPVPFCTLCVCRRYAPGRAGYQCAHDWYTYFAGGAPSHRMCLRCCKEAALASEEAG